MGIINFYSIVGFTAGCLSFVAYLKYIHSTLYGSTRPNKATWSILTLVGILILVSYYQGGARDTIWVPIAYVIGPLIITIVSFKKGESGWSKFDIWCLIGSIISMVIWFITSSPLWALLINIFIDFLGLLPTIRKSYLEPGTEDRSAWVLESVSGVLNVVAIKAWVFSIYIYPVYLALVNGSIAILLVYGMYKKIKSKDYLL